MEKKLIEQPTVVEEFKKHLNDEHNKRILFSAPFGTGKSTFLNEYFTNNDQNHIVFKLYPVNYAVASSEDIFELIKYELLAQLFGGYYKQLKIEQNDFALLLVAQSYFLHEADFKPIFKKLFQFIPKGKEIVELGEAGMGFYKRFKDYSNKVKENGEQVVEDYNDWCKKRKGSIYERDEITLLINDFLNRLRDGDENKKLVLIIDDLDRLDPEHVFRLFNVFSAHYDTVTEENKFGFDKVIFVCDYDNIKEMYSHRYGEKVNFEGYINKFYSTQPFAYDNRQYVIDEIESILNIKALFDANKPMMRKKIEEDGNTEILLDIINNDGCYYPHKSFIYILSDLVITNHISLRELKKFTSLDWPTYEIDIENRVIKAYLFKFLVIIHLLKKFFKIEQIKEIFNKLSENNRFIKDGNTIEFLADAAVVFLVPTAQLFNLGLSQTGKIDIPLKNTNIEYITHLDHLLYNTYKLIGPVINNPLNIYTLLHEALKVCVEKGYVK